MPLFRIGHDLHYFAHVPKCGGTSVEAYLAERFGPLGFLQSDMHSESAVERWWKSTPQHIPIASLFRLIPPDWIASSFAVVRNPLDRIVSAFGYARKVQSLVPMDWTLDDYVAHWAAIARTDPYAFDGHLRPQTTFVLQDAKVFRLEDGLDAIIPHLDLLAGNSLGPRSLPRQNVAAAETAERAACRPCSVKTLRRIRDLYAEDFARFGYAVPETPPLADAPAPAGAVRTVLNKLAGPFLTRRAHSAMQRQSTTCQIDRKEQG